MTRAGFDLDIPAKGSLAQEAMDAWAQRAADSIDRLIDKTAEKAEQARMAAELSRDFIAVARNALADPNRASNLNFTQPPKTYAQLEAELGNPLNGKGGAGKGGDALYDAIIEASKRQTRELGCFVAGTRVQTREGLKPIEQIKVGDYVLSKPESGVGVQSYQRVTRTYQYEDREVYFVAWFTAKPRVAGETPQERGYVVVTGAHPFWVVQVHDQAEWGTYRDVNAWMSVEDMLRMDRESRKLRQGAGYNFRIELNDGRVASLQHFSALVQHRNPDIGVAFTKEPQDWSFIGPAVQFTHEGPVAERNERGHYLERGVLVDDALEYDEDDQDAFLTQTQGFPQMRRTVYNIEVENTHTYYVGEPGVWVHNTSERSLDGAQRNPGSPRRVLPPPDFGLRPASGLQVKSSDLLRCIIVRNIRCVAAVIGAIQSTMGGVPGRVMCPVEWLAANERSEYGCQ